MLITYIRVDIALLSPWRVGAPTADRSSLATLTDTDDAPVIPPSSLAGSFRAHLGADANCLMGSVTQDSATASPLWFLGTRLEGPDGKGPQVLARMGTAIDRNRRAARKHGSHSIDEVHGAGRVRLYLRFDGDPTEILQRLGTWRPSVGGGITVGLGKARVAAIRYRSIDTVKRDDLIARASMGANGPQGVDRLLEDGRDAPVAEAAESLLLEATVSVDDLHLHGRDDKGGQSWEHAWFHGTRWKGILRSRVEYIGRSLGLRACGEGCGECAVCEVFGSGKTGAGLWMFESTRLDNAHSNERLRGRNAIDRFTGGVLDQRLFHEGTSSTSKARLAIAERAPLEPHHAWVAKALLLALKDVHDGFIGIGGRSATGLGSVRIASWRLGPGLVALVGDVPTVADVPRITTDDVAADQAVHPSEEGAHA